jgi:cytochrome c oxidase assembly protein subunit 15
MEWAPLSGTVPPWSEAEWRRLFALYQTIPQYSLRNAGMDLAGFKEIFWLEWVHRLWGRLLGLAFAVPLAWFWWRGRIEARMRWWFLALLALGGAQGAVGWFMVASGFFPDSTAVAPWRLTIHLGLAFFLYGAVFWTALTVLQPRAHGGPGTAWPRRAAAAVTVLIVLTVLAGAMVAGTKAGFTYNTFPLMDGRLVPAEYGRLSPLLRDLSENLATIQFHHRVLATLTLLGGLGALLAGLALRPLHPARLRMTVLAGTVFTQYVLGIATLLLVVPVDLAVAHQIMAVLALSVALARMHALRTGRRPAALPDAAAMPIGAGPAG